MGLIVQAARLVLCKCRGHGTIVYGDGSKSEEFFSTTDANGEIADALMAKKILPAEAEFLREEVRQSDMLSEAGVEMLHQASDALKEFAAREHGDDKTPPETPASGRTLH
jgi:hypothetical protein